MHSAYLLTWNPKRYPWRDLEDDVATVRAEGGLDSDWSCGSRRSLPVGSRLFLMRLGLEPKGIIGSAVARSEPYEEEHWVDEEDSVADTAWYVDLHFDRLESRPLIGEAELQHIARQAGVDFSWTPQASGVEIPQPLAEALEEHWRDTAERAAGRVVSQAFTEGAPSTVKHTRYERDPAARRACIEHHGSSCAACGLDFASRYGDVATGYIEVHHLVPLGEAQEARSINPITDLVPLCPNCHAVVHLRKPPYSVAEVRGMIENETRRQEPG